MPPSTIKPRPSSRPALAPAESGRSPIAFTPIRTERLLLRPLRPTDAEALHRLINDWDVVRTLALVPYPYPRDLADSWIASTIQELLTGTAYHVAITGDENGEEVLVGVIGLNLEGTTRVGRIGYWVGRRFWGHGVATEATDRLVRWALANLDIDRVRADVDMENPASAAVLRRIGFRETGQGTADFPARGGIRPVWNFETTRDAIFGQTEAPASETGEKPLLLVVACALIDIDGRILLARRPEGKKMAGLWEFPGGKLNPGEVPEAALIRELKEELGIDVSATCLAPFAFASHAYDSFHLLMPLYLCRRWKGTPTGRENQTLAWVRPQKLADYEMPAADKPLIPLLRDFL